MLHRRYAPRERREPRRRTRALPLAAPSGHVHGGVALHRPPRLRPGRFAPKRPCPGSDPGRVRRDMLEIDVAGRPRPGEARSRSTKSRTASSSSRSPKITSAWARSSAPTTSSRRTTPRPGRAASSSACRRAWSSTIRSTSASRARRRRDLLAAARRRRGRQPLLAHRGVHVALSRAAGYSNAAVELFVEQGAKLEYVSLQNLAKETWNFATHRATVARDAELDWVAGGFGSRRGKVRIHNDSPGKGRRRASPGRTSRTARSTSTTTRSSSTTPRRRPPTSPSRARSASRRASSGGG